MSRTGSWVPQKLRSVVNVVHADRFISTYRNLPRNSPIMSAPKLGSGYRIRMHPGLHLFSFSTNGNTSTTVTNVVKNAKVQQLAPASPSFNIQYWLRWVLVSLLSILLSFRKHYWQKLQRLEGEAESVVEEVEKVANAVEKVSEEVAEKLPEDGELKKTALAVESVSKQVAQLTLEFIHKVDELKNDLDDLESFVEPIIDKVVEKQSESK